MTDIHNLELKKMKKLVSMPSSVCYVGIELSSLDVSYNGRYGTMTIKLSSRAAAVTKFFKDRFGGISHISKSATPEEFVEAVTDIDNFLQMFYP